MLVENQVKLTFHGVDIIHVNYQLLKPVTESNILTLNVKPKIHFPKDSPKLFRIMMEVDVFSEDYIELQLVAVGQFEFLNLEDEEFRKQIVNVNAPAIMFPYVRSFITTFSSSCGSSINRIIIPPHSFKGEIEELDDEFPDAIIVSLNKSEVEILEDDELVSKSTGGWQSLIKKLKSQLNSETGEITLLPDDIERIKRYINNYKSGGWQKILINIFSRTLGEKINQK